MNLCLVVHNEADRIEGLVGELVRLAGNLRACLGDVLVVDDASTDETAALLARLLRRHPGVKILRRPDDTAGGRHGLDGLSIPCGGAWILLCGGRPEPVPGAPGPSVR